MNIGSFSNNTISFSGSKVYLNTNVSYSLPVSMNTLFNIYSSGSLAISVKYKYTMYGYSSSITTDTAGVTLDALLFKTPPFSVSFMLRTFSEEIQSASLISVSQTNNTIRATLIGY